MGRVGRTMTSIGNELPVITGTPFHNVMTLFLKLERWPDGINFPFLSVGKISLL